jgi:hypothetical protein
VQKPKTNMCISLKRWLAAHKRKNLLCRSFAGCCRVPFESTKTAWRPGNV